MMTINSKNLRILVFLGFLFPTFPLSSYADSKSEDLSHSVATLSTMLRVAEAGDWERYVDEFYGEQHKFRSSSDREKLILRFRAKWGSKVIAGLREASRVKPHLSKDGSKAIFQLKNGKFILYKNEKGDWMFHL
ncbi:exported hypothetical protein [Nitrospina gracilis 3/211]|uniref:DUF4440 domain-containing protein n=1 Tax=Nitrospina gracilis (strain 3/211) TaxID=1266370 RepID=M1YXG1_NITG3|nr:MULTISPECIES: hypothetical protein [Nitrospina]MCF8723329.1 hypothetical protein [Nitrospina sp. Nb-3]CCQ90379.1 exported hypothetical protein [Nitrospina gracilis 3/211]